jgi:hypothetical protein
MQVGDQWFVWHSQQTAFLPDAYDYLVLKRRMALQRVDGDSEPVLEDPLITHAKAVIAEQERLEAIERRQMYEAKSVAMRGSDGYMAPWEFEIQDIQKRTKAAERFAPTKPTKSKGRRK